MVLADQSLAVREARVVTVRSAEAAASAIGCLAAHAELVADQHYQHLHLHLRQRQGQVEAAVTEMRRVAAARATWSSPAF